MPTLEPNNSLASNRQLEEKIEKWLAAPLKALGIVLLEVQWRAQEQQVLRLLVDALEGEVGVGVCARASEMAGRILEVEDPIGAQYTLEVSSPGIYRRLSQPRHFLQSIGKGIRVTLDADWANEAQPQGKKDPIRLGTLKTVEEDTVVLETVGGELRLAFDHIRNARLDPERNMR